MKNILCFGDSNVFGYNPSDGLRYSDKIRWSGLLKDYFSNLDVDIKEEGQCNRTTFKNAFGTKESGFLALENYFINNPKISTE